MNSNFNGDIAKMSVLSNSIDEDFDDFINSVYNDFSYFPQEDMETFVNLAKRADREQEPPEGFNSWDEVDSYAKKLSEIVAKFGGFKTLLESYLKTSDYI